MLDNIALGNLSKAAAFDFRLALQPEVFGSRSGGGLADGANFQLGGQPNQHNGLGDDNHRVQNNTAQIRTADED